MQDNDLGFIPDNQNQPNNEIGFVPDNNQSNLPGSNTFLNKFSNMTQPAWNDGLGAVVLGLTKMGGNLIGDAGTALTKAGANHLGSFLQNKGNQGENATPEQVGIQNPGLGTGFISGVTQASPYILTLPRSLAFGALSEAPYLAKILSKPVLESMLSGGLFGATQSDPGHALEGTLNDAATAGVLAQIPSAGMALYGAGKDLFNAVTNRNVRKGLATIYNDSANDLSPKDLNNKVVSNILHNYESHLGESNSQYQDILNNAELRGYGDKYSQMVSPKFINPSEETKQGLNDLLSDNHITNLPSKLRNSINNYLDNPTYKMAHNLQSDLGDFASGVKVSKSATMPEKDTASLILGNKSETGLRRNLVSDIYNNFKENGDEDLADDYGKASKYWKENVLPYRSISQIKSAVIGNKPVSNINNVLLNNDKKGYLDVIRGHIQQSPEQQSDLTANLLNKGAVRTADNSYKVDPNKMTQIYNSLPSYVKDTLPKSTNDLLQKLSSLNEKNSGKLNAVKNLAKVGGLALGGLGIKKAIDYL